MPTWCRYCHQEGHTKFDCSLSKARTICYFCQEQGRRSFMCPHRHKNSTNMNKNHQSQSQLGPAVVKGNPTTEGPITVETIISSDNELSDDTQYKLSGQMSVEAEKKEEEDIGPEEVELLQQDFNTPPSNARNNDQSPQGDPETNN